VPGDEPIFDLEDLLNPDEQARFRRLCLDTAADELAQLAGVVELHLEHIRNHDNPSTDVETAERIAASLMALLSSDGAFDAGDRALIRGAVEYYLLADDASGDLDDNLGFDDDARVLNSVLRRINRPDLVVKLLD
jgi:hypothetical protein